MIDWLEFVYAASAIFQPYNGGCKTTLYTPISFQLTFRCDSVYYIVLLPCLNETAGELIYFAVFQRRPQRSHGICDRLTPPLPPYFPQSLAVSISTNALRPVQVLYYFFLCLFYTSLPSVKHVPCRMKCSINHILLFTTTMSEQK